MNKQMHAQQSGSWGSRTLKINTIFIVVVFVHIPKYISGQHLYGQASACTAKWKLWCVGPEK